MRRISSIALALLTVLSEASCSEPRSSDVFVKAADRDAFGRYEYKLDMSDSLCLYDISFYTRIDASEKDFTFMGDIPLMIRMYDPSGVCYEEKVFVPFDEPCSKTAFTRQYKVLYRKDAAPVANGEWTMQVEVQDLLISSKMRGLGVKMTRK